MIAALLPLLPLLQAVPLHIDAAKNAINERIRESQIPVPVVRSSDERVIHTPSSSGSAGPGSTPLSDTSHSRKRKRPCVSLDRHRDLDDINMDGPPASNRNPVHLDSPSSSVPAPRIPLQPRSLERPANVNDNTNYARTPLSDSAAPLQLQSQPRRTISGVPKQHRIRPASQSHFKVQNHAIPTSAHRPHQSRDHNIPRASRRPLADLIRPADLEGVIYNRMDEAQIKTDNRPIDVGTPSLKSPNVSPSAVTPRPPSSHLARSVPLNRSRTGVTVSSTTAFTSPDGSSSSSSHPSTESACVQHHANSSSESSVQSSNSNDRGLNDSTDGTLVNVNAPLPIPHPVAAPILPVQNSVPRDNINTNTNDSGSFLVPMIKPMIMQRSWTSIVSRAVCCFTELYIDSVIWSVEEYREEIYTA